MTRKRHLLRRFAKWAGLAACVLVLVAWPVSLQRKVIVMVYRTQVSVEAGMFAFVRWPEGFVGANDPFHFIVMPRFTRSHRFLPRFWKSGDNINGEIPLFGFLLAAAIPTFILFRRDRRHPPGHCQKCGYDLTSNVSGVCPECGTSVAPGK